MLHRTFVFLCLPIQDKGTYLRKPCCLLPIVCCKNFSNIIKRELFNTFHPAGRRKLPKWQHTCILLQRKEQRQIIPPISFSVKEKDKTTTPFMLKRNPLSGSKNPRKTVITKELGKILIPKSVPMRTLSLKSCYRNLCRRKIPRQPS